MKGKVTWPGRRHRRVPFSVWAGALYKGWKSQLHHRRSLHCPPPPCTLTSHPLQSFRARRFSAVPTQRDGKKKKKKTERQRWPRVCDFNTWRIIDGKTWWWTKRSRRSETMTAKTYVGARRSRQREMLHGGEVKANFGIFQTVKLEWIGIMTNKTNRYWWELHQLFNFKQVYFHNNSNRFLNSDVCRGTGIHHNPVGLSCQCVEGKGIIRFFFKKKKENWPYRGAE